MKQAHALILTAGLLFAPALLKAEDIILRLSPDAAAPVLTRMVATEKVLLDAAPAGEDGKWRQLELKIPFEGYVPAAALTKSLAIIEDTPVHFLPDANSETITQAKDGDLYEIVRVQEDWATVKFQKKLTTYFRASARAQSAVPVTTAPPVEMIPAPPVLELPDTAPAPVVQASPAPTVPAEFDPSRGVGITSPENLPPENVVWKSVRRSPAPIREPQPQTVEIDQPPPPLPGGIIVSRNQTQAREANPVTVPEPDVPLRLLVGKLVRQIEPGGPGYPIRLLSDEGHMIAYVDFSGIFIQDLSPYLNQRVYLRGQIAPIGLRSRDLVIHVRDIQVTR